MAIRRIGFNDNFRGGPGFVGGGFRGPGGPGFAGRQGFAPQRPPTPRAFGPGGPGFVGGPPAVPKVAPAAAPVASTPVQPAAAPQPRVALDDPEILSDPVLLKVRKLAETQRGDIRAGALARKKQLAIQTGSDVLAREFGFGESEATAARDNPLSAFAAIRDASRLEERDLEEGLNKANLHFGGYRGTQLGELARSILAREANAQAQARQSFSGIESELLGGLGDADEREMQAEADAYFRAVARRAAGLGGSPGVVDDRPPPIDDRPPDPGDPTVQRHGVLSELESLGELFDESGRLRTVNPELSGLIAELLKPRKPDALLEEILRGRGGGRGFQAF